MRFVSDWLQDGFSFEAAWALVSFMPGPSAASDLRSEIRRVVVIHLDTPGTAAHSCSLETEAVNVRPTAYRNEDRTLLEYQGLSNVKRPDGDNYVVRIHFPPEERTAVTLTASAEGER